MVTPQMPGGGAVGQAILDHQTHGHGEDTLGIVAAGGGQPGEIGTEMELARRAVVPGVGQAKDTRSVAHQAAEVVQGASTKDVTITGASATRARSPAVDVRPLGDQGRWEIFDTGDALGTIGDILSRTKWHGCLR